MQKKTYAPDRIAAFDLETSLIQEGRIHFHVGSFHSSSICFSTHDEEKFFRGLIEVGSNFESVFAHNAGKFDALWFMDACAKYEPNLIPSLRPIMRGSRVLVLDVGFRLGFSLVDSMGVFPGSLERTAQSILGVKGKEHGLGGCGTCHKPPICEVCVKEKIARCEEDTKLLYLCLVEFFHKIRELGGSPKPTLASIAMSAFKHHHPYKLAQYLVDKRTKTDLESIEREAYAGGRCEVFRKKAEGEFFVYDINSMYPFVMRDLEAPVGKPRKEKIPKMDFSYYYEGGQEGVAYVEMDIPDTFFASPVWTRRDDGRLLFVTGRVSGWYCLNELRYFHECGVKIMCFEVWTYASENIFEKFVNTFWEWRQEAKKNDDMFLDYVCKLILNSCYGKFGERRESDDIFFGAPVEGCLPYVDDFHGFPVWKMKQEDVYKPHVKPLVSAYVTAQSRILLHSLIARHEESIIYCDTDSLFTYARYPESKELGGLKLEAHCVQGVFVAPKMYSIKKKDDTWKHASKGFSLRSWTKVLDENGEERKESIQEYLNREQVHEQLTVKNTRLVLFKEQIKKGEKMSGKSVIKIVKKPENEKRVYGVDGNSRPIHIDKDGIER